MSGADARLTAINILVAIGACIAGFIIVRMPRQPVPPPNDPWFRSEVIDRSEPVFGEIRSRLVRTLPHDGRRAGSTFEQSPR